jgi:hypothetical protein
MTTQHPITPPPELVQQWCHEDGDEIKTSPRWYQIVATKAARWGADAELQACCKWLPKLPPWSADDLRKHRRPEPTLKEQARDALGRFFSNAHTSASQMTEDFDLLRRAVEALPE